MKSYGICLYVWLILFSWIPSRSIHLSQMARVHSFLWLSNIPLYIYHIFFIHLSFDGHFSCFQVLALVHNTAMIYGCIYIFILMFLFSLEKYPEVELLDCTVALFWIFWGTSILFSIVVAPVGIHTNSACGFRLLSLLLQVSLLIFLLF